MILNRMKTAILLAALSGMLMLLGSLMGGRSGIEFALILSLVINTLIYFFSDKIVLAIYRAQPLDKDQYSDIYDIVDELSNTMQMPMPRLWIIHSQMANAFATGRSPSHASVAVTTGILSILDKQELRGVLAHELSHVKNRDILVATIAATIASAIGYLANFLHHAAIWTSFGHNDRDRRGNPLLMILVAILMPLAASLIQLALSRSREYLADETGAHECRDPLALASALEKLHRHIPQAHLDPKDETRAATASLFIVNPFSAEKMMSWFSTHPPVSKRIERLQKMFEKMKR